MEERTTELTARLVISVGDSLMQVVTISKAAITLGRRQYNDVCLDDLTVSGEHAVIRTTNEVCTILDLNSRNGTLINGMPVTKQPLEDGDIIDIGTFRIKFVIERLNPELDGASAADLQQAKVVQLNGRSKGKETRLNQPGKPIVSLGKAGSYVAAVAKRKGGFYLTHIEGLALPLINGETVGIGSYLLKEGDSIELGGTMYRFHLAS